MRIRIVPSWTTINGFFEEIKKQSQNNQGKWGDIQLCRDGEPFDATVIINADPTRHPSQCGKDYYFCMEPYLGSSFENWRYPEKYFERAHRMTHDVEHNLIEWHINSSRSELLGDRNYSGMGCAKLEKVSVIQSMKNFDIGHKKRITLIHALNARAPDVIECFGYYQHPDLKNKMGSLPARQKNAGLMPYKYHIAAENNSKYNYFTEKLVDGILSECLVFYWGCPNVEDYIEKNAFVRLEMTDLELDCNIIMQAISENLWEKRLPAIRRAKQKILNELQIFPHLEKLLSDGPN